MRDEKIKVEVSATNFVGATDKVIELAMGKGGADMLKDMDADDFKLLQASMKFVGAYKELCVEQAKAIDQLTEIVGDLKSEIKSIGNKIDNLKYKNVTDK